jgi:predicted nucleic acid-binding protein
MAVKVVDASALGALLFGEPQAQAVAHELANAGLAAPALLAFEVANIAVKKIGRHPELRAAVLTALAMSERMAIETIAVDQEGVVRLATETGLTAYDASYLWLARILRAELITLDQALAAAFAAERTSSTTPRC